MLSNSITCYKEILHERKSTNAANFILVLFQEIAPATKPSANTKLISQQPSTSRQDPLIAKGLQLSKGSDCG